jgi:hypothetical protein
MVKLGGTLAGGTGVLVGVAVGGNGVGVGGSGVGVNVGGIGVGVNVGGSGVGVDVGNSTGVEVDVAVGKIEIWAMDIQGLVPLNTNVSSSAVNAMPITK